MNKRFSKKKKTIIVLVKIVLLIIVIQVIFASLLVQAAEIDSFDENVSYGYIDLPFDDDVPAVSDEKNFNDFLDTIVEDSDNDFGHIILRSNPEEGVLEARFPDYSTDEEILDYLVEKYPSTRNQNPYGTCWAHSAVAMAEFNMINKGLSDEVNGKVTKDVNYSELQLAYFCYHTVPDPANGSTGDAVYFNPNTGRKVSFLDVGGNWQFAGQMMMKYNGVADEIYEDLAYSNAATVASDGLDEAYAVSANVAWLKNMYNINIKENPKLVKQAVKNNGAVGCCITCHRGYYNYETNAYYNYNGKNSNYSHAVTIVGWDDNYPANNFSYRPSGNGAWLVRNSWSDKSDLSFYSYFWVSYYDKGIDDRTYVFDMAEKNEHWDNIYDYDSQTHNIAQFNCTKCSNVFTVSGENELLQAVQIDISKYADVQYTIEVYRHLSDANLPDSGERVERATTTGTLPFAGGYTIKLNDSIELEKGEIFSVVVTTEEGKYIDCEYNGNIFPQLESNVVKNRGESFLYKNGKWTDVVDIKGNWSLYTFNDKLCNLCIRALTENKGKTSSSIHQLLIKNVSVSDDCVSVSLKWDRAEAAQSYLIYKREGDSGDYSYIGKVNQSSNPKYLDMDIKPGYLYYYRIVACKDGDTVEERVRTHKTVSVHVHVRKIDHLEVDDIGPNEATLKWSKVNGAEEYLIKKKDSDYDVWYDVDKIDSTKTEYSLKNLQAATSYTYGVCAKAGGMISEITILTFKTGLIKPEVDDFSVNAYKSVYNGKPREINVSSRYTGNKDDFTVYYAEIINDVVSDYSTEAPSDAGEYKIRIQTKQTDKYEAATLEDDKWRFVIEKAKYHGESISYNTVYVGSGRTYEAILPELTEGLFYTKSYEIVEVEQGLSIDDVIINNRYVSFKTDSKINDARSYLKVRVDGGKNYQDFDFIISVLTVNKRHVNIKMDSINHSITYGYPRFKLNANVESNEDLNGIWNWSSENTSVAEISPNGVVKINSAGVVKITVEFETDKYYGKAEEFLHIDPKDIKIIWNEAEFEYDGNLKQPEFKIDGLIGDDSLQIEVKGGEKKVGNYWAYIQAFKTEKYILRNDSGKNYRINPRCVVVSANNISKKYNERDPKLSVEISNMVPGEKKSQIQYKIVRAEGEEVGDYAIEVSGEKYQGNYSVDFYPGVFSILEPESTDVEDKDNDDKDESEKTDNNEDDLPNEQEKTPDNLPKEDIMPDDKVDEHKDDEDRIDDVVSTVDTVKQGKVPLLYPSDIYASSNDNFAPVNSGGSIKKLVIDFTNVEGSGVDPDELCMTVVKGSKMTVPGCVSATSFGIKVKCRDGKAYITTKQSGYVIFDMDNGKRYTVKFLVENPKTSKRVRKLHINPEESKVFSIKELFGTNIDGGVLSIKLNTPEQTHIDEFNNLIISPKSEDSIQVLYKYLNKKYKTTIKIR